MNLVIVETSVFTKRVSEILSDDEYRRLQWLLSIHPDIGDVIKGSGGLRKVRWVASGSGKRGGTRVIYYWVTRQSKVLMLYVYRKNEREDLTSAQLKQLRKLIEEEFP